jgi:hypothetical protein
LAKVGGWVAAFFVSFWKSRFIIPSRRENPGWLITR